MNGQMGYSTLKFLVRRFLIESVFDSPPLVQTCVSVLWNGNSLCTHLEWKETEKKCVKKILKQISL